MVADADTRRSSLEDALKLARERVAALEAHAAEAQQLLPAAVGIAETFETAASQRIAHLSQRIDGVNTAVCRLASVAAEHQRLQHQYHRVKQELDAAHEVLDIASSSENESCGSVHSSETAASAAQQAFQLTIVARITALTSERDALSARVVELSEQLTTVQLGTEHEAMLQEELQQTQRLVQERDETIHELQAQVAELTTSAQAAEEALKEYATTIGELQTHKKRLRESTKTIEELQQQIEELSADLATAQEALATAQAESTAKLAQLTQEVSACGVEDAPH